MSHPIKIKAVCKLFLSLVLKELKERIEQMYYFESYL